MHFTQRALTIQTFYSRMQRFPLPASEVPVGITENGIYIRCNSHTQRYDAILSEICQLEANRTIANKNIAASRIDIILKRRLRSPVTAFITVILPKHKVDYGTRFTSISCRTSLLNDHSHRSSMNYARSVPDHLPIQVAQDCFCSSDLACENLKTTISGPACVLDADTVHLKAPSKGEAIVH